MQKVYFYPVQYANIKKINHVSGDILGLVGVSFKGKLPIKVHFGEKGNPTFIKPSRYNGIILYLKNNGAKPFFTDTNVLYKGARTFSKSHIKIACQHGFKQLPIVIADDKGYKEIAINKKYFKKCKIGKVIADARQMVVISHFKGHGLVGFGGALKQLSMGCAARAGKLEMHAHALPMIDKSKCKKCLACVEGCLVGALFLEDDGVKLDKNKCIGCAQCIAVCPHGAIGVDWGSTGRRVFSEKLAEYALAAQKYGKTKKKIVYLNFVYNLTEDCDCWDKKMKIVAKDLGILASVDPVALDQACLDLVRKQEGRRVFFGDHILKYAEKIGLGKRRYQLIKL